MKVPVLTKEELMQAISDGVERAVWSMITNATSMPCSDFFDSIKEGVEAAHLRLGSERGV